MIHPAYIIGGFIVAGLLLGIFIFSVPLFGYWLKFLRIKITGGGLIMVKWRSKTDDYFKVGKLSKLVLKVKKRHEKHFTELTMPSDRPIFYRLMGVNHVDIDEQKNGFCTVSYEGIEGFDEETYENIIIRALMSPEGTFNWKVVLIGLGIIAGAALITILLIYNAGQTETAHYLDIIENIKSHCTVPSL